MDTSIMPNLDAFVQINQMGFKMKTFNRLSMNERVVNPFSVAPHL